MENHPKNNLSKRDATTLLEIINDCHQCSTRDDAYQLIFRLKNLLDSGKTTFGLAVLSDDGSVLHYDVMNFRYTSIWLGAHQKRSPHKTNQTLKDKALNFRVQFWANIYTDTDQQISTSPDFNLLQSLSCNKSNAARPEGQIISLSGGYHKHSRDEFIVKTILPHLNQVLRCITPPPETLATSFNISSREIEVLNWVKQGKSTWDISQILDISERTVKFHVNNIMNKLNAVNRTHAVAIAFESGILK